MLKLSICIVAYNEEKYLPRLLADLKAQKYPHELTEIVLVDGMSADGTKRLMEAFQKENKEFYSVQVVENPKRIQAAGWNLAITHATGDVIARIDAHTMLPPEYSSSVMHHIENGENVVGGMRPCLIENQTPWGDILLQTENSLFGSSINRSRHSQQKSYVKTMFHAAYRREVFERAGLFNEGLLRTEDNEMHYRIRESGYRLCYDPQILSYQYARSSLRLMLRQKFGNGKWVGITTGVCPKCLSAYHYVPFLFVLGIVFTSVCAAFGIWQLAALMWGAYLAFALCNTVISAVNARRLNPWMLLMPILFLVLHVIYGVGTAIGLCGLLFNKKYRSLRRASPTDNRKI